MDTWRRQRQRSPKYSNYFACFCLSILFWSCNRFVKVYKVSNVASTQPTTGINVFRLWPIKDENHFTEQEYDVLLTSSLRQQHFDDVGKVDQKPWNGKMNYWDEIIEGKGDYFTAAAMSEESIEKKLMEENRQYSTCEIQTKNVLFLKTHYTGSDVITNVINRFADIRGLTVALPSNGLSSFFWPSIFDWRYMEMRKLEGNLPNVLCNHARYNHDVMEKFMPFNTRYVTMLRNPVDYFVNLFEKLNIAERVGNNLTKSEAFDNFVLNIQKYLKNAIKEKRFSNEMNLLKNGMFFDLGLHTSDYNNEISINSAIFDIQAKFSLVLIWEHLDQSLVLLKRKFCWDIDDVIYLSLALPRAKSSNIVVSSRLRRAIGKWNHADAMLYDSLNASFWEKIRREKDFHSEVAAFRKRREEIDGLCEQGFTEIPSDVAPLKMNLNGTLGTQVEFGELCKKMRMTTREYLDYFWDKPLAVP